MPDINFRWPEEEPIKSEVEKREKDDFFNIDGLHIMGLASFDRLTNQAFMR